MNEFDLNLLANNLQYLNDPSPEQLRAEEQLNEIQLQTELDTFDNLSSDIEQAKQYFFVNKTADNKYFIAQDEQGNNSFFTSVNKSEPAPRETRQDILPDETKLLRDRLEFELNRLISKRNKCSDRNLLREFNNDIKEVRLQLKASY